MVRREDDPMPSEPSTQGARSYLADDTAFDELYPEEIRAVSRRFWTPVATARRAATLLAEAGARAVLDVGAGAGKFGLVAAALFPELRVVGVEQRAHLVEIAEAARARLGLANVRFVHGDATSHPWAGYDGFYFYNSFAENLFDRADQLDDRAELSFPRFARDVQRAAVALRAAPVGAALATYYGSSGRVPSSYELAHQEAQAAGWLRLWVKRHATDDGSFFVEDGEQVVRHAARTSGG
jgi:protein-L-isoaspartate O-methyltransferase